MMPSGKSSDENRTIYWNGTCNGHDADGELAYNPVQSDEAIAVYKAITQSPNSAIAR